MYDMVEGAPLDKIHDALQTVAKIHMASWDDDCTCAVWRLMNSAL